MIQFNCTRLINIEKYGNISKKHTFLPHALAPPMNNIWMEMECEIHPKIGKENSYQNFMKNS